MKSQQWDTGADATKFLNLLLKNILSIARQISQVDMATENTGNQKAEQMFLKEKNSLAPDQQGFPCSIPQPVFFFNL